MNTLKSVFLQLIDKGGQTSIYPQVFELHGLHLSLINNYTVVLQTPPLILQYSDLSHLSGSGIICFKWYPLYISTNQDA